MLPGWIVSFDSPWSSMQNVVLEILEGLEESEFYFLILKENILYNKVMKGESLKP